MKQTALIAAVLSVTVLLAGCGEKKLELRGQKYPASSESIELSGWSGEDLPALSGFASLRSLDLRSVSLSPEAAKAIEAVLPESASLLWCVPLGGRRVEITAETVSLPDFRAEDAELLKLFPHLTEADLRGSSCYSEILSLAEALPGCAFRWSADVCGKTLENSDTALDLSGTPVTADDLAALAYILPYFPNLSEIDLTETGLSGDEIAPLLSAFPSLVCRYTVSVAGEGYPNDAVRLDLTGRALPDADTLIRELGGLPSLQTVDLHGAAYSKEELLRLKNALPSVVFLYTVSLLGQEYESTVESIDLSGMKIKKQAQMDELYATLGLFSSLKTVDMCNCGPSNEEMDALNRAFPDTRIVWMIRLRGAKTYTVRTDAIYFSTALKSNPAKQLWTRDAEPLKYCTDLEALDLGHNEVRELEFLTNLPKLRYLILAGCGIKDVSPLAELKELEYLELFANDITDISPLAELPKLRDLNISLNYITDLSPLVGCDQLERVWASRNPLEDGAEEAIRAALPDCTFDFLAWSPTGNGWRKHENFYAMREFFHLPIID